jgi:hypothetical protein
VSGDAVSLAISELSFRGIAGMEPVADLFPSDQKAISRKDADPDPP